MVLELVYVFQISPTYSYLSLELNINYNKMFFSYFLYFCILYMIPVNKLKPSTYLINILFVLMWIPTSSYFWLNNQKYEYMLLFTFSFIILFLVKKIRIESRIFDERKMEYFFSLLFVVYLLTNLYLVIKAGGIDLRALNFDSVYEVRGDNKVSGFSGYLLNWCSKVFFPFYTVYFINSKKNYLVSITIVCQLLLYFSYANKAFLFSIIFVFMCIYLLRKDLWVNYFPNAITGAMLFSLFFNNLRIGELLTRTVPYRLLYVPAQIQFWYFDYFSDNEKLLYGESFLGSILGTHKSGPSTSLLINKYFTNITVESNANTGVFSDAFSNGGGIAMFVTAMIILFLLLLIDSFSRKINTTLIVAAFSYSMFILNDTSLLTSLNTGGILLLLSLFYLYSPKEEGILND